MTLAWRAMLPLLLAYVLQVPAGQAPVPPPAASADDELRATIQQYYDAQAQRDPDKAASFWSATANPRVTRDTFLAVFGTPADEAYTIEIRSIAISGNEARVRVAGARTRAETREGHSFTARTSFANSQIWRKETTGWKILRDGPFAEGLADQYLALAEAERPAFLQEQPPSDLIALRYTLAQRASMAVTLRRDYPGGRALFARALEVSRAAADRRGEANSLHNIAQASYFLGDREAAVDGYEKELAIGRQLDDAEISAGALFGLGTVAYGRAEYANALGFYREALGFYEKREDGPAIGRTVVSIGNVQYLQAEYDAASASYRRGLALALESSDRSGATFARRGLGRVLAAQGDLAAALEMHSQVLADARADLTFDERLKSNVGAALVSVGEIHFRLGNTDQARSAFTEAKQLAEGDPESAGRVLSMLGMTELVAGRFDAAFAAYSDSRTRFEAARNGEGVARAWVGVGFAQTARQKFTDAVTAYKTAIDLFTKLNNNDGVARAWLGLSRAQSGGDDEASALESAARVAALADQLKSDDLAWRAAERSGEALRKLARFDEAKQAFARAVAAVDRLAAEAPTNTEARGDLADSASVWAGLALTLASQGDAAGALDALEARRAHIRRVDFAAFQRDIAPGATAEEIADEQAIVRAIISARAQLNAETKAGRPDPARIERLRQQLTVLAAKRAEQQSRLYARVPDLRVWRGLTAPVIDPASLTEMIPGAHGLLVAYLVTDDELLILSAARGESGPDLAVTVAPLDRRAFAAALAAAMQPAVLGNADEWRPRAAALAAGLFQPISGRLAGRDRLVIIPDDLLWKVPFEALPMAAMNAAPDVTYATALATLDRQRRLAPLPEHRASAFLASPAIPEPIRAQLQLTLPAWKPQDADSALAAARAAAAAYGEGTPVRSAADASERVLRAAVTAADVLHVQAPLQVSGAAPLLSSMILSATGDSAAEDGRFEAREWFGVSGARTRVAVLPDGSTFGAPGVGNAMDPIAWAMTAAGVATIVLGRWPADAFARDTVVAAFHARLAAGASVQEAWHAAVAAARSTNAAPAAWIGVRLVGAAAAPPAPDDRR